MDEMKMRLLVCFYFVGFIFFQLQVKVVDSSFRYLCFDSS